MTKPWQLFERIQSHAANSPSKIAYLDIESSSSITYRQLLDRIHEQQLPADYRLIVQESNAIELPEKILAGLLAERAVYLAARDAAKMEVESAASATRSLERLEGATGEILLSSSGTTGLPKIVRRTRDSLDNLAKTIAEGVGFTASDKIIAAIPMTHSYGLEHCILAALWAGSSVLICRGLDISQIGRAIQSGATIFPAVPSMIELLGQWSSDAKSNHQLRLVYTAGAMLPSQVADCFETHWKIPVGQIYGLTELGSIVYHPPGKCESGVVGRALPGVSVKIISTDGNLRPIAIGELGEVTIYAQSMMSAYVGGEMPCVDGHLRTGDLGYIDSSGELHLTGRLRLLIDVGGAKVNPLEVEAVLNAHPDVAVSVVLPLRLSDTIQKVRAVVVPVNPDSPPEAESLRQFVRQRLSAYKVPRVITFAREVPRSATGKILRHAMENV